MAVAVVTFALEFAFSYFWRTGNDAPVEFTTFTIGAFENAAVIAITRAAIDDAPLASAFSRMLERVWAVLIVNFAFLYVSGFGTTMLTMDGIIDRLTAAALLLFAASLVFCETVAVVIDDDRWWMLVPHAFGGSVRVAWSGSMMWKALALFGLYVAVNFGELAVYVAMNKAHLPLAAFWSNVPIDIIWAIPFNVLTTVVFLEAIGYEPKHPCSE